MLKKANTLKGYELNGLDGNLGTASDVFFDDRHWTIRYLVSETGSWLTERQVLISPYALGTVDEEHKLVHVKLTRLQIENSPLLATDKPVSRQFEESYYSYFGWPMYWDGPYAWGSYPYLVQANENRNQSKSGSESWDPFLRSTHDVSGHDIQATDGEIGHVEDFIIDVGTWTIRYLVIATQNWWPGKKVLISPEWIERISWNESKVFINLTREAIKRSPEYSAEALLTREYETGLHRHYDRPVYWID